MLKMISYCIYLYQRWVSIFRPAKCRFLPTCSDYTHQAIHKHGYYGLWLGFKRILRCHPWGKHGIDEVPPVVT